MLDIEPDIKSYTEKESLKVSLSPILLDIKYSLLESDDSVKKDMLEKILDKDTQAIRILAAGTKEQNINSDRTWQSPGFDENDNNGLCSGGVYRVAAAAIVMNSLPQATCIVGSKYPDDSQPAPSVVMKEELAMMGFDKERIMSDPNTTDTISELVRLVEICEKSNWNNVVCITNRYHCERVEEFLNNLDWLSFDQEKTEMFLNGFNKFKNGVLKIKVIPAEDVIEAYDVSIYDRYVTRYLNTKVLENRREAERKGVNLLHIGQYARFNSLTNTRKIMQKENNPPLTLI